MYPRPQWKNKKFIWNYLSERDPATCMSLGSLPTFLLVTDQLTLATVQHVNSWAKFSFPKLVFVFPLCASQMEQHRSICSGGVLYGKDTISLHSPLSFHADEDLLHAVPSLIFHVTSTCPDLFWATLFWWEDSFKCGKVSLICVTLSHLVTLFTTLRKSFNSSFWV